MNKTLLTAVVLLLGTCGLHSEGMSGISHPPPYQAWHIVDGRAMQQALDKALRCVDGKPVGVGKAQAVLTVSRIGTRKDIYTVACATEINKYLLILYIGVQASANGEPLGEPTVIVVNRKMDYVNGDVLDKAEEEQAAWSEICTDAAEQTVRRLTFPRTSQ